MVSAVIYLAALIGSVLIYNADAENAWSAIALASIASVVLGFLVDRPSVAALAIVALPVAVPFGYADEHLGSDGPQVWWFGATAAVISAALIVTSIYVRRAAQRRRGVRMPQRNLRSSGGSGSRSAG